MLLDRLQIISDDNEKLPEQWITTVGSRKCYKKSAIINISEQFRKNIIKMINAQLVSKEYAFLHQAQRKPTTT